MTYTKRAQHAQAHSPRLPLQGTQRIELIDGDGPVLARMVTGALVITGECAPGRHCAHHCESPHPCCRCGAEFVAA